MPWKYNPFTKRLDFFEANSGGGPFQPLDGDLTAISALAGTGLLARTGSNTWALRDLVDAGSGRILITNPGGVAGNPTLDVDESALDLGSIGGLVAWTTQIDFTGSDLADLATRSHSDLQDLTDPADDHTQYLRLLGRAGGQLVNGGTNSLDNLIFVSNPAQDGSIFLGALGLISLNEGLNFAESAVPFFFIGRTYHLDGISGLTTTGADLVLRSNDLNDGSIFVGGDLEVDEAAGLVRLPGALLSINGLNYSWPAAQGADTYLRNDGAGALTWVDLDTIYQPLDADLTALAGLGTTGILVRTGAGTAATRSIAVTDSSTIDFSITDGDGVAGNPTITASVITSGIDHGGLGGLGDDDHTQYLLLAGRSGGQIAIGGTGSGDDLTLQSTSHATKGTIFLDDFVSLWPSMTVGSGATVNAAQWAPTITLSGVATARGILMNPAVTCSSGVAFATYWQAAGVHVQTTTTAGTVSFLSVLNSSISSSSSTNGVGPWCPDTIVDNGDVVLIGNGTEGDIAATTAGTQYRYVSLLNIASIRATSGAEYTFNGAGAGLATVSHLPELAATGGTGTNSKLVIPFTAAVEDNGVAVTESGGGVVTLGISTTIYTRDYTRAATGIISSVYSQLEAATNKWTLYTAGTAKSSHRGAMIVGGAAGTTPTAQLDVHQGTITSEVLRLQSTTTGSPALVTEVRRQGRVTTTNNTATTLMSYTLTADRAYLIEARVVGHRTGGAAGAANDSGAYVIYAGAKHTGGAAALITAVSVDYADEDQAGWVATMDVNGNDVRVRVTGATDNNITWHCTLVIQEVGT